MIHFLAQIMFLYDGLPAATVLSEILRGLQTLDAIVNVMESRSVKLPTIQ